MDPKRKRNPVPPGAMEKAALLASKGRRQKQIAVDLSISAPTVNRLLAEATRQGILIPRHPQLNVTPDRERELEKQVFGQQALFERLRDLSDNRLQSMEVYPAANSENALAGVTRSAAYYVVDRIIARPRIVAITWGSTMRALVSEIQGVAKRSSREKLEQCPPTFIQVTGDPAAAIADPSLRSATFVSDLNTVFGKQTTSKFSYSVSASIPRQYRKRSELKIIREFICGTAGYANVFGLNADGSMQLTPEVDTLLTGCRGKSGHDGWLVECAENLEISPQKLEDITIGNIGGYWLSRDTNSGAENSIVDELNSRWTGIHRRDIETIARRRGVILVAAEEHKSEIVRHLVREGLVSVLLTSSALADRMGEDMSSGPAAGL